MASQAENERFLVSGSHHALPTFLSARHPSSSECDGPHMVSEAPYVLLTQHFWSRPVGMCRCRRSETDMNVV
jgi:hypothetical protein